MTIYEFHNEFNCSTCTCSHLYLPISTNNYALGLEFAQSIGEHDTVLFLSYLVSLYYKELFLYRDIKPNTTHAFNTTSDSINVYKSPLTLTHIFCQYLCYRSVNIPIFTVSTMI